MPEAWVWVALDVVHAIHDRQIAEHGGAAGTRDNGAIESALAKPQNLFAYEKPDTAGLAAAYAYGLTKNHGFIDGNKRTAWVVARLFLSLNKKSLSFAPAEAVTIMQDVAGGAISELAFAEWFRERI